MARRRRDIQAFSLSFLDCICCGFGAIILLLVLSKIYEPVVVEEAEQDLMKLGGIQLKYKFLSDGYFTGTYEQHKIEHEPTTWALRLIGGFKF